MFDAAVENHRRCEPRYEAIDDPGKTPTRHIFEIKRVDLIKPRKCVDIFISGCVYVFFAI
jgi:hypothetical protein